MALSHSVTNFLAEMRQRTDNEGTTALERFPDSECLGYLNRAVATFWRMMVESRAGGYAIGTAPLTTTAGTSLYALNATFYRLLGVYATINSVKQWIVPMDANERAALSDTNAGWTGEPFRYELVGGNIEFLPTPSAEYDIEVRYVPNPPTLIAGQSFDCVNGDGVNFIVDTACVYMAEKDENFELSASLKASAAALKEALTASLPNRDQNYPPRIQDVRGLSRGGSRGFRIGRWSR